ncbi:hypothetical protein O164_17435 [Pseudomonas taiwanensis SJ9]|uniref:Tail assembly protein n=2 Tax=Pseudomonas TaxID=286 RepID=V7D872_9PSED|nr:hypothetical protein O164_17435 [Pseudomonas taiwanensis SJ9]
MLGGNMAVAQYEPMTIIKLSGSLARRFGRVHRRLLQVRNFKDACKALCVTLPGFDEELKRLDSLGMRFAIFRNGQNVGEEEFERGGVREIRIVPVVSGAKRGGMLQTVLGVALIALAYFNPFGFLSGPAVSALYAAGAANVAGGVIQALSPQAGGLSQSAAPENLPSYAFGSARNTTASGNPVPICIGERRWGGAIISASIEAQDKA